jgi:hypothetical protein
MEIKTKLSATNSITDANMIFSLQENLRDKIIIDQTILNLIESREVSEPNIIDSLGYVRRKVFMVLKMLTNEEFLYSSFDSRYFYKYENGTLFILGPEKARDFWLDWWKINFNKYNNGS